MSRRSRAALALLAAGAMACARPEALLSSDGALAMRLPGNPWQLRAQLPGFAIETRKARADGGGVSIFAVDEENGFNVSVFLERQPGLGSAVACRELYWSRLLRSPVPVELLGRREVGAKALVSGSVAFDGHSQLNTSAYLWADDLCVDIHLSKVDPRPEDYEVFGGIFSSAQLVRR